LFRLEERSYVVQTGGEELSCSDWKTGGVIFRLQREVVLFRLEERSCLVKT
jgi:hypothetical protein